MGIYVVVGLMAIVTVLPRITPVFIMDRVVFPSFVSKLLRQIPYAILGALIFPGVLQVEAADPRIGIIGALVAAVLAYWRMPIVIVICGSILAVMAVRLTL